MLADTFLNQIILKQPQTENRTKVSESNSPGKPTLSYCNFTDVNISSQLFQQDFRATYRHRFKHL